MIPSDKKTLRKHIRHQRRQLSRAQQTKAAQNVCLRILRSPWWRSAQRIAFYWSADGEINLLPLLRESLRRGKQCYLPVVKRECLEFREYRRGATLKRNGYGIPEPQNTAICPTQHLDLILLPLVAFDRQCNRLGMGAGFYDRALAHRHRKPLCVGTAYEFQRIEPLPTDPWDVPLHAVITERRGYRAS